MADENSSKEALWAQMNQIKGRRIAEMAKLRAANDRSQASWDVVTLDMEEEYNQSYYWWLAKP